MQMVIIGALLVSEHTVNDKIGLPAVRAILRRVRDGK